MASSLTVVATQPTTASGKASRRLFQPTWLDAGFVVAGMITVLLGPILPTLELAWGISTPQAGLLFTAQFAGSTVGVLASGGVVRRCGFRASLVAGYLFAAAGVALLEAGSWAMGMAAAAVFGAGLGLIIPGTNMLVAGSSGPKSAARLSWLNLAWGIGAVILPLLAGAFVKTGRTLWLLEGLAALALLCALRLATLRGAMATGDAAEPRPGRAAPPSRGEIGALAIFGALFFLYVGAENGLGGWIASYTHSVSAATPAECAMAPFFFWGALLLGRALGPAFLRRGNEIPAARLGSAMAALGGAVVIFSRGFAGIATGAAIAGFGLAEVFPITISRFAARFADDATRYAGAMFALAGAGGAVLPWLVGYSAAGIGKLGEALWIPVLAAILISLLLASRALAPADSAR